ncbi:MAG: LytTR family DNA-binding domain-containing protein [Burkholderiaceae bacterium]|jgi:two-component system response regulator AlgR|nr:LytTR family DNA-binding domain-containing protein [Burkholderiaceae bacterium]
MTALHVLVVDDEKLARARLRALLDECEQPRAEVTAEAASAAEAIKLLAERRFDVALLDIHMPGADGLQLARMLAGLAHPPQVVFVTAHAEHALQAFELEAVDYLTKPVRRERLAQALQKAERMSQMHKAIQPDTAEGEWLLIVERGRTLRVPLAQVLYFKAELKYLTVGVAERTHLLDASLNQIEERYPGRFLRIHRGVLVAAHALRALEHHIDHDKGETWTVRLDGIAEPLPVARRQVHAVRDVLEQRQ